MKKTSIILFFSIVFLSTKLFSQITFRTVSGFKANYTILIPNNYFIKASIGGNVDIKYVNSEGASIITVVRTLPAGVSENDIQQMDTQTDEDFINAVESNGLQNISVIKKGFIIINGVKSYFTYYKDNDLYYHAITQFRKGKLINLTYTCEYTKKVSYMPYIFRVVNSLKS